jgi:hypothetical protein
MIQECSIQSTQMRAMGLIVSHLVTMTNAKSKILVSNDLSISNVLLVEILNFNLLSVAQLCDLGFKCIFGVDNVEIISVDGSNLIFKGFRYENLYLVDFDAREAQLSTCLLTKSSIG